MVTAEGWLLGSEKKLKTFKQMFEVKYVKLINKTLYLRNLLV